MTKMGKAFLGMAMAEMMHMQMLGQLVCLLVEEVEASFVNNFGGGGVCDHESDAR